MSNNNLKNLFNKSENDVRYILMIDDKKYNFKYNMK